MIPIVGRFPFALARLFGSPGPGAPVALDGAIYPTLETDSERPERAFLQGERLFCEIADVTGGGGQSGGVTLTVPSTQPNLVVIIEKIRIQLLVTAPTNISIFFGNLPAFGLLTHTAPQRDTRMGSVGNAALWGSTTNGVAPAINAQQFVQLLAVGDVYEDLMPRVLSANPVAGQTNGLCLFSTTFASRCFYTVWWRERPLNSAEVTL